MPAAQLVRELVTTTLGDLDAPAVVEIVESGAIARQPAHPVQILRDGELARVDYAGSFVPLDPDEYPATD